MHGSATERTWLSFAEAPVNAARRGTSERLAVSLSAWGMPVFVVSYTYSQSAPAGVRIRAVSARIRGTVHVFATPRLRASSTAIRASAALEPLATSY
eukprot:506169-Rhodomonas_salina.1